MGFLTRVLLQLSAVAVGAGCSAGAKTAGADAGSTPASADGGNQDGGSEDRGPLDAGTPICTGPVFASPSLACQIAAAPNSNVDMAACIQVCAPPDAGCVWGDYGCSVSQDYSTLWFNAHQAGMQCPDVDAAVVVQCNGPIGGRSTAGFAHEDGAPSGTGEALARRAYLEAVSVFAFERLERELLAHGAPIRLVRAASRARKDEVRHAMIQSRFARRYGSMPRRARRPASAPTRRLFEIALENAIEGCVRETCGALVGLIEARTSTDPEYRRASRRIALDECRHAELAWAVHRWACSLLPDAERRRVEEAMREAVDEMASSQASRHGDALRRAIAAMTSIGSAAPGVAVG